MALAFDFRVTARDGQARCGVMTTAHGAVQTPAFMPVGTRGAVKALTHRELTELGADILLANTYHLHVRPGDDLIARRGGLHRFIGWNRPILTDSGGYQVFSLCAMRSLDEEGVRFRSHLDGRQHALTPESAAEIQWRLGSDIAMVLDECTGFPLSHDEAASAVDRTARWAGRGRDRFLSLSGTSAAGVTNPGQAQFGIVQGSTFFDLRERSVAATTAVGFEGYAIGGLSVGEPVAVRYAVTEHAAAILPEHPPRYLMGAGTPADLVECVGRGIDLFDCVLPTRNARHGQLFTRDGRLMIKNARYAEDDRPPDPACGCYTCRTFSRAYLRHLFLSDEMVASTLNTLHNLHFYLDTMRRIREAIAFGSFENFRQGFLRTYSL
ncbi:MAG: tRNA guanosine(34) transglycosylase Tgt [Acidobacteria bacterium]|nr:tRNA guanosine(34) transglycosylase Tgt [Acidobacteriota bacterium]